MINTTYFSGIVKILETPNNYSLNSQTQVTQFRVELPQKRKNSIISLLVWGNLGRKVQEFYKRDDYILIEGYSSIRSKQIVGLDLKNSKQVFLTVIKVYPILLNPDRTSTKM
jgi:hypothetical protein